MSLVSSVISPSSESVSAKEMVISLLLGIPDGVTYFYFGLLAGSALAGYLGLSGWFAFFLQYVVGLGAALGVAFFAVNNVSREYRNVFFSQAPICCERGYLRWRQRIRTLCVIVAVLSVIPFTGMAMNAGSHFSSPFLLLLLVISNTFARFCMNDFALSHTLIQWCDYFFHLVEKKRGRFFRLSNRRLWWLIFQDKWFKTMSYTGIEWLLTLVSLLGVVAGAFTATYLYRFAFEAAMAVTGLLGLHSLLLGRCLAMAGVIPTAFLWANDARTALVYVVTEIANRVSVGRRSLGGSWSDWLLYGGLFLLLAVTGAFSETRMAYHAVASLHGWYPTLLMLLTPIAFAGIYGVSVIELTNKFIQWVRQ